MTSQQNRNSIRLKLTGDDGRCVKSCETCDGSGQWSPEDGSLEPCSEPDCTNGFVENRERIERVIEPLVRCVYEGDFPIPPVYVIEVGGGQWKIHFIKNLDVWDNRHGTDYQQALEEFVLGKEGPAHRVEPSGLVVGQVPTRIGGFVEPAPDYNTPDGMVLLKEMLLEADGFDYTEITLFRGLVTVTVRHGPVKEIVKYFGEAPTEHEASSSPYAACGIEVDETETETGGE